MSSLSLATIALVAVGGCFLPVHARVCEKPDGRFFGVSDFRNCALPNRDAKFRPDSGFLGLQNQGKIINYDTAKAQGNAKTTLEKRASEINKILPRIWRNWQVLSKEQKNKLAPQVLMAIDIKKLSGNELYALSNIAGNVMGSPNATQKSFMKKVLIEMNRADSSELAKGKSINKEILIGIVNRDTWVIGNKAADLYNGIKDDPMGVNDDDAAESAARQLINSAIEKKYINVLTPKQRNQMESNAFLVATNMYAYGLTNPVTGKTWLPVNGPEQ